MKDIVFKNCSASCHDVVYKEVVVIGNGPSGMVTSFMLAGNVPYLKSIPENLPIDEMLKTRLSNVAPEQSLYDVDLMTLAEGLEGRSQNPIPLLMDSLLRPCADMGIEEESLIEWRHEADKEIDHIVLGRGLPGGAWHTFPPNVLTLSPGAWLSLPPHQTAGEGRLPASAVASYCVGYVKQLRLQRYFRNNAMVTAVTAAERPRDNCECISCVTHAKWNVTGIDMTTGVVFRYRCKRVVVAGGGTGRPNKLPRGQHIHAVHSLTDVQKAVDVLRNFDDPTDRPSVLVVGSGVSAADAVWLAREAKLHALHLHRDPAPALANLTSAVYPEYHKVYKMMCHGPDPDEKLYTPCPEHIIIDIKAENDKPKYLTKDTKLQKALQQKTVKLLNVVTNEIIQVKVSLICVLIGSKPDLFYLKTNTNQTCNKCIDNKKDTSDCFLKNHWHYLKSVVQSCKSKYLGEINSNNIDGYNMNKLCICDGNPFNCGIGFGVDPDKPVDCRGNPICVDKSSHEVLNSPKGMYALGPLTADNFIRFIPGGALAIVADIHKNTNK